MKKSLLFTFAWMCVNSLFAQPYDITNAKEIPFSISGETTAHDTIRTSDVTTYTITT